MKRLKYSLLLCVTLFFISSACTNIKPSQHLANATLKPVDAIIVPGIPFNGARWDSVMKGRVIWAYILWKNGVTKNIIFSGGAVYTPYVESKIMGLYARELGIPAKNIYYDTLARHSTENVYYSYLLAKKLGFKSIALATDPVQALTLRGYLNKRFGTPVRQLPFVIDSLSKYNHLAPLIAIKGQLVTPFESIKDTESFFRRWRGTLGRDIPWDTYPNGIVPAL